MITAEDQVLKPEGELSLRCPADATATNMFGDIYGGWVASKAVLASEIRAAEAAEGRMATVSIGAMSFMAPVLQGTVLGFYTQVLEQGTSSLRIKVEVWGVSPDTREMRKVSETECVQVAIDGHGHIRALDFGRQ
ncbi:acyl-CoA thioesterase [Aliamphritea ceti]|uniref:acyl-CoA thioesterase n=1 Tax=Aliamphritea ceti TaxID=1524258 RepID=UPI0021C40815|nr:hotdog domain-containing protein [Aliamphritea ceti]